MDKDIERLGKVRLERSKKRKKWLSIVILLAVVALGTTVFQLIQPASAATQDLAPFITSVIDNGGLVYDPVNDCYIGDALKITFKIPGPDLTTQKNVFSYNYPADVVVKDELLNIDKTLYDSNGVDAGTYRFVKNDNGTYSVILTFAESYVTSINGGTVTGYVSFESLYHKSDSNVNDKVEIKFSDTLKIEFPPEKIETLYDINVDKSGSYVSENEQLSYTVLVYSKNGTPDRISFEDILDSKGLNIGKLSGIKVNKATVNYYNEDNHPHTAVEELVKDKDYTYTYSNGIINMDLPVIEPATKQVDQNNNEYLLCNGYYVTYTYDMNVDFGTTAYPSNVVKVKSEDKDNGKWIEDQAQTTIAVSKNLNLAKWGWDSNNRANWTISVNSAKTNIAGMMLTDDMFERYDLKDLAISPDNGYELVYDNSNPRKFLGIKFNAVKDGKNTQQYTVTYNTKYKDGEAVTVNKAYIGEIEASASLIPPGSNEGPRPGEGDTGKDDKVVVDKEPGKFNVSADWKSAILEWNTKITVPVNGIPKGTVIKDELDYWQETSWFQYFTHDQLSAIIAQIKNSRPWLGKVGTFQYKNLNYEWKDWSDTDTSLKNNKFVGFRFTLTDDIKASDASTIVLNYNATCDLTVANDQSNWYNNTFKVGDVSDRATYTYINAYIKKTDGQRKTDISYSENDDGALTWKVEAMVDNSNEYYETTITDALPVGVRLESLDIQVGWTNKTGIIVPEGVNTVSGKTVEYNDPTSISESYDYECTVEGTNVVTEISRTNKTPIDPSKMITITYHCKVDTEAIQNYKKGKEYSFKNNVTINMNGKELFASHTQKWKDTYKVVSKNGNWDQDAQRIHYSVAINKEAEDLVEGSDTLTLEDVLSYYVNAEAENRDASLVRDSVKLYECTYNEEGVLFKNPINNWTWEYSSNYYAGTITGLGDRYVKKITATIPDSKYLILEYDYLMSGNFANVQGAKLGVSNEATISGTSYKDVDDKKEYEWSEAKSSAGITTYYNYRFYKVEKGDYNHALANAQFTLFKCDNGKTEGNTTGQIYTTNDRGTFSIYWQQEASDYQFEEDVLYYVMETATPNGYSLPEKVHKFYFYFDSDGNFVVPAGISATNLMKNSKTEYVENELNTTAIEVLKIWKDINGDTIQNVDVNEIYVDLYQYDQHTQESVRFMENVKITPGEDGNWLYKFENLPKTASYVDENGNKHSYEYQYYVKEKNISGYEFVHAVTLDGVEVSANNGITQGTIVLTNKATAYELPATGGSGTRMYVIGGLLLSILALIGLLYKRNMIKN